VAVDASAEHLRALADENLVFLAPFHKLGVSCRLFFDFFTNHNLCFRFLTEAFAGVNPRDNPAQLATYQRCRVSTAFGLRRQSGAATALFSGRVRR
jgi:hypothetical protein